MTIDRYLIVALFRRRFQEKFHLFAICRSLFFGDPQPHLPETIDQLHREEVNPVGFLR